MSKIITILSTIIIGILIVSSSTLLTAADSHYGEKLEFAVALDEILGHFWALEQNLDEGNTELALVHASHPIAELYDLIKPELVEHDSELDGKVHKTLMELGQKTGATVSRQDAQKSIDEAKSIIEQARLAVIGEELSNDASFKLNIMKDLLEISKVEYEEAVSNGIIQEMAEFQDGSSFVWISEQIFNSIKSQLPEHEVEEIEEFYSDLWDLYDARANPSRIETVAGGIVHEINEILGEEYEEDEELLAYVENIEELLSQAKNEYANGNQDLALSLVTKAYLDNFEYLEGPLVEVDEEELMEDIEHMMREELRDMIKQGAPVSEVEAQIDTLLIRMESVETVVPEFGSIALLVMVIAITGIVLFTMQNKKIVLIPRF